jgi:hypothetical protein
MYGPMALIGGNTVTYLSCLRDAGNDSSAAASDARQRRREKFVFADFAAKAGGRSPKTVALVVDGMVQRTSSEPAAVASFVTTTAPHGHYFCKPNKGRNGIGAFRLTIGSEGVMMDEEPSSADAVATRLSAEDYLIQEWMAPLQHPDISRFRNGVINTMRLVTFHGGDCATPAAASLRMAISLKSIDSWTQGGVVAAIDLERGALKPFGILKKGLKIVEAHPGTGLTFRDQSVPHFREAIATACRLHSQLDKPKSIGWDIALLADGPCFLEANGPWDVLMSAQFNPDLVPAFLAFHVPDKRELAVRVDFNGSFTDLTVTCRWLCRAVGLAMASGRLERLESDHLRLTVGGTRQAVQKAMSIFKSEARAAGARTMTGAQAADQPARGFDMTAVFAKGRSLLDPAAGG